MNVAVTCRAKFVSLKLYRRGTLTAVYIATQFSDNHGHDAKSRQWLKITAHGHREFLFFLHP